MNLNLDDTQLQLQDSLARLLANEYSFEFRRQYTLDPLGHSHNVWKQLAEIGVFGMAVAEAYGGFGGDAVDQMLVAQALGRVLALEPNQSTAVITASAMQQLGSEAQKQAWLPRIVRGEMHLGWAHCEQGAGSRMTARLANDGTWRLSGLKHFVLNAPNCSQFIVTVTAAENGQAAFLVDANAVGVNVHGCRLLDDSVAGDVQFDDAYAECLDGVPLAEVGAAFTKILHTGIASVCAEMVGLMEGACEQTFEYIKTRKQFGTAIGSNQALQHRSVEMLIALEQSRSLATSLALSLAGRNDLVSGPVQFHAAKVLITRNAYSVTQEAIQMHGGMGMTEECAVGHYLRRVLVLDQLHGDTHEHMREIERL